MKTKTKINGSGGSSAPVHLPPTGVNGKGEIIGCHCKKCMPRTYKATPIMPIHKKNTKSKYIKRTAKKLGFETVEEFEFYNKGFDDGYDTAVRIYKTPASQSKGRKKK